MRITCYFAILCLDIHLYFVVYCIQNEDQLPVLYPVSQHELMLYQLYIAVKAIEGRRVSWATKEPVVLLTTGTAH